MCLNWLIFNSPSSEEVGKWKRRSPISCWHLLPGFSRSCFLSVSLPDKGQRCTISFQIFQVGTNPCFPSSEFCLVISRFQIQSIRREWTQISNVMQSSLVICLQSHNKNSYCPEFYIDFPSYGFVYFFLIFETSYFCEFLSSLIVHMLSFLQIPTCAHIAQFFHFFPSV